MKTTVVLRQRAEDALLATARTSQALVIDAVDRVVGTSDRTPPRLLRRLGRIPAGLPSVLLDGPAQFVDDGYELLERLTALHREFAQRVFEAMTSRGDDVAAGPDDGPVLLFRSAGAKSAT